MPFTNAQIDKQRGFKVHGIDELYTDLKGEGVIPNKNDLVADPSTGMYIVTEVDYANLTYEYVPWNTPNSSGVNYDDIVTGAAPGWPSESFRMYINKSVTPNNAAFDMRLRTVSTRAKYVVVYRGADITDARNIISIETDSTGSVVSDRVYLDNVVGPGGQMTAWKEIREFQINVTAGDIPDGELITGVVYSAENTVISTFKTLAMSTDFVRNSKPGDLHIANIELLSHYLDEDEGEIRLPTNVPMSSLDLRAKITYTNGQKVILPNDGNKVTIQGLSEFTNTVPGRTATIVLKYSLAGNEKYTLQSLPGSEHHIARSYDVRSIQYDGLHAVKIYSYPTWDAANTRYRLKHWLVNLDRNICKDVTSLVSISDNSPAFNPVGYGVKQTLGIWANLNSVDASMKDYNHAQHIHLTLRAAGTNTSNELWDVEFEQDQTPSYGNGLRAKVTVVSSATFMMTLDSGYTTYENWVSEVFWRTLPMFDPQREVRAPDPTHFELVFKGATVRYDISQWNQELIVPNDYATGETIFIKFIHNNGTQDLHLGVSAMPVEFV
jgi:hypothetical protein